jgi:hypothetical protein
LEKFEHLSAKISFQTAETVLNLFETQEVSCLEIRTCPEIRRDSCPEIRRNSCLEIQRDSCFVSDFEKQKASGSWRQEKSFY